MDDAATRAYWETAPDDPQEAKKVEVDRRVKLTALGEHGQELLRATAEAVRPEGECPHGAVDDDDDEPCPLCQGEQWISEILRAMAAQLGAPEPRPDPPEYKEVREQLDKFWLALGATIARFPREGQNVGQKLRNTMHPACRDALALQKDTGSCDTCQLTLMLSGGFMMMGDMLAKAQGIPPDRD